MGAMQAFGFTDYPFMGIVMHINPKFTKATDTFYCIVHPNCNAVCINLDLLFYNRDRGT